MTTATATKARMVEWFSLAAFSAIAMVSLVDSFGELSSTNSDKWIEQGRSIQWTASAITIALIVSGISVLANVFLRDKFYSTKLEGGMAVIAFGLWAAVLRTIMNGNGKHDIAVYNGVTIKRNNLYFFSWASMIAATYVLVGYLKDCHGVGTSAKSPNFHTHGWALLAFASLVVMVASSDLYKIADCKHFMSGSAQCNRLKSGTALGGFSAIVAIVWYALGSRFPVAFDAACGCAMFVYWLVSDIFIDFGGEKAPAYFLGNLYFSSWASFIITIQLALRRMPELEDKFFAKGVTATTEGGEKPLDGEGQKPASSLGDEEEEPPKVIETA